MHITGHVVIKTTAADILTTPNLLKWAFYLFIGADVAMSKYIPSFNAWCTTFVGTRKGKLQIPVIVMFSNLFISAMERTMFTLVWTMTAFVVQMVLKIFTPEYNITVMGLGI